MKHMACSLSPAEIAMLADKTEGWPIALHLVWQSLRGNTAASRARFAGTRPHITQRAIRVSGA